MTNNNNIKLSLKIKSTMILNSNKNNPKLTIGMSIYNGEKFILKKLENILSQTFQDFELIISDDSTDNTPKICKDFADKDNRIHYTHQPIRKGWRWNYIFTLKNAETKYFVWTAVDDIWEPNFLEETIKILDSNPSVIGSISKMDQFNDDGIIQSPFSSNFNDSFFLKQYKKIRIFFRPWTLKTIEGEYFEKCRFFLKLRTPQYMHGVMRTAEFKKSSMNELFSLEWETVIILNLLKYGNFFVIDKKLIHYYMQGLSSDGAIESWRNNLVKFNEIIFPFMGQTTWCRKNLGLKFFVKNLDLFILLFIYGEIAFCYDVLKFFRNFSK